MRWLALAAAVCACHGSTPPLYPAGSDKDEGHGLLAQASTQIILLEGEEHLADDPRRPRYGGNGYGGNPYGGSPYAGYVVPAWPISPPNRTPRYHQVQGLTGVIEGTIANRAATKLATTCGGVEAPRGAIVYIEKVTVGRTLVNDGRPASVGGTIVKRGCTLLPSVQIVTPLPAALVIAGDGNPAPVRVTTTANAMELEAGGRIAIQLPPGVTRVDGATGQLGAAWVVALDAPYYAVTDDHGRFRIDELATGTYEVTIWQPPQPRLANRALTYGEPVITKRTVKVETGHVTKLDLR